MLINAHDHFSLLRSSAKNFDITRACVKRDFKFCAVTNHGTLASCVSHIKACSSTCACGENQKKHFASKGKCPKTNCPEFRPYKIKPILGCELYISDNASREKTPENRRLSNLSILAKNLAGWKELIKIVSFSNHADRYYYNPRVSLQELDGFNKNKDLVVFSGQPGSTVANLLFTDIKSAYNATTYESAKSLVIDGWESKMMESIDLHRNIFGKENFFLQIQSTDAKNMPAAEILAKAIRYLGKKHGIPCVGGGNPYYAEKDDAKDQRVLLASGLKTTISSVEKKIANQDDVMLSCFFKSNNYHIPTMEEFKSLYSEDEIKNIEKIGEMCETYDISAQPMIPSFPCPNNMSPIAYLRELCIEGWKKWEIPQQDRQVYGERVKYELDVLDKAGLANYFLIVQDFCKWAKERQMLLSPARGSAAGCLISGLIGIADRSVDPVKNGLFFDRFYNSGRITPGKISLPDIDCDFPVWGRELVIDYVRNKYGEGKVCQISTYGRMQGRGAVKDVLRAHGACSFAQMDLITKHIPQEASIADDLQEMVEETGESSIIRWTLENTPKLIQDFVVMKEDGTLEGDYANYFNQAMRMEGLKRNRGKHAAGVIISSLNVSDVCPMVYDTKSKSLIAGLEMNDLDYMGLPKFDFLGLACLDKLMNVGSIVGGDDINMHGEEEDEDYD